MKKYEVYRGSVTSSQLEKINIKDDTTSLFESHIKSFIESAKQNLLTLQEIITDHIDLYEISFYDHTENRHIIVFSHQPTVKYVIGVMNVK